jgi:hypothetical protein
VSAARSSLGTRSVTSDRRGAQFRPVSAARSSLGTLSVTADRRGHRFSLVGPARRSLGTPSVVTTGEGRLWRDWSRSRTKGRTRCLAPGAGGPETVKRSGWRTNRRLGCRCQAAIGYTAVRWSDPRTNCGGRAARTARWSSQATKRISGDSRARSTTWQTPRRHITPRAPQVPVAARPAPRPAPSPPRRRRTTRSP